MDLDIQDYLTECFTKVEKPTVMSGVFAENVFLKNMNYSFNPFENTFNANFDYYYTKKIESDNILI